ncbi:MAG TPA: GDP-mannose 4,6-dehydratase [Verrucomicrobiae bacterium]|nr:GDP-mannose 4,6-dehydratase [Verrucomicrobiae bacterium]
MKRAAITGITGQDGTYLARWLVQQGYEVHGLLRSSFDREAARLLRRFGPEQVAKIQWHTGSMEDPFSLVHFLKASQPDEVYHLAGVTDSRQSFDIPGQTVSTITLGTLHLLEAAREICAPARIFLASSCEIFGVPAQVPQDETTLKQPVTPYGIAKLAADQFARLHREKYGQFVSTGILYNHESPLRPQNYLSSRVARAVAAIRQGRVNELSLAGLDAERDWSDARDFVRGFWLTLQARAPSDYVFASGRSHRVGELVECAFRTAGLDYHKFVKMAEPTSAARQVTNGLCGNARRAEIELQWTREWDFHETIEDMVRAELDNRPEIERANPLPQRIGNV